MDVEAYLAGETNSRSAHGLDKTSVSQFSPAASARYSWTFFRHASSSAPTQDPTAAIVLFLDLCPWVICISDFGSLRTYINKERPC